MTISEKILSSHSGKPSIAGDITYCNIDHMMLHDATGPLAIKAFSDLGGTKVFDAEHVSVVLDHCSPAPNERIANLQKDLRKFAKLQGIHLMEDGVCHQLIIENELVKSGDLVIGADSHTCTYGAVGAFATGMGSTDLAVSLITGKNWFKVPETIRVELTGELLPFVTSKDLILTVISKIGSMGGNYKAFEFYGDYLEHCSLADRMTIANMVVEMGGKAGFLCHKGLGISADNGANYCETILIDLTKIVPCTAKPHKVDNWAPVTELKGMHFQYAYLGSCTNGRIEDLRIAANILRGKKIANDIRLLVVPASNRVLIQAAEEGILKDLIDAGAMFVTPGCAACVGTHGGIPADGDIVVTTTNRNFKGRMGNNKASIYLVSPATLAASCLFGEITDPRLIEMR